MDIELVNVSDKSSLRTTKGVNNPIFYAVFVNICLFTVTLKTNCACVKYLNGTLLRNCFFSVPECQETVSIRQLLVFRALPTDPVISRR